MKRKEMIAEMKSGKKAIGLSIQKWIDIRDGKGVDDGGNNCACYYESGQQFECCQRCPIDEYEHEIKRFSKQYSMCESLEDDEAKKIIAFMRKVRRWMIKEGIY